MKSERMSKLLITGPKAQMEKVINKLHELKILHIVDHKRSEDLDIGIPTENSETLSRILVTIRSLAAYLDININQESELNYDQFTKKYDASTFLKISKTSELINGKVIELIDKLKEIDEKIKLNSQKISDLELIKNLDLDLDSFSGYNSISSFLGFINPIKLKQIEEVTTNYEIFHSQADKKDVAAIFVENESRDKVQEILNNINFTEISLSNLQDLTGSPKENLAKLEQQNEKLENQRKTAESKLEKIKNKYTQFLLFCEHFLSKELEKAQAPLRCASSKNILVVRGFMPRQDVENVAKQLYKITNKKISIQYDEIQDKESIPIKLKNSKIMQPFEFFMNLYTLPNYHEIDPTSIMFWTFPLLFGFILGDFGYGIVTLALFYWLKKKLDTNLFDIGIVASFGSIFFGVLFGEVFGEEVIFGIHLPHILSRAHAITELLYLAVAVGVVHVNLGLIMGFYNELKHHGLVKAILEKGSWFLLQASVVLLALSYTNYAQISVLYGYLLLAVSVIMLYLGEGAQGIVEIPGIFSNILSYARLMAVGVSSVLIALVVNEFAKEFFHQGGFMILAGLLTLVVGHTINIALGLLGGFLHSLRLHYVEFFSKFYKGGGKKYVPFGTGG